jgi:hypothetical protein
MNVDTKTRAAAPTTAPAPADAPTPEINSAFYNVINKTRFSTPITTAAEILAELKTLQQEPSLSQRRAQGKHDKDVFRLTHMTDVLNVNDSYMWNRIKIMDQIITNLSTINELKNWNEMIYIIVRFFENPQYKNNIVASINNFLPGYNISGTQIINTIEHFLNESQVAGVTLVQTPYNIDYYVEDRQPKVKVKNKTRKRLRMAS